jgi:hypothetical protein
MSHQALSSTFLYDLHGSVHENYTKRKILFTYSIATKTKISPFSYMKSPYWIDLSLYGNGRGSCLVWKTNEKCSQNNNNDVLEVDFCESHALLCPCVLRSFGNQLNFVLVPSHKLRTACTLWDASCSDDLYTGSRSQAV